MITIRAVLFDFFGTLTQRVRRGPAHRWVAELLGCPVQTMIQILDESFYLRASGALGDAEAALRWVCARAGTNPSEAALGAAVALRQRVLRAETRLRAEAVPVLAALRGRGLRTGLITDCTDELPALLPHLAIDPLLDARVFSVEVGRCKPDPALYRTACRRLDVAPWECLYLGDGGSQELSGAERSGMTALRLAAPDLADHLVFNPEPDWRGPTLHALGDLVEVVDRIRATGRLDRAGAAEVVDSPGPVGAVGG